MRKLVNGYLTKDVEYHREGVKILIPAETEIQLDVENNIGHWNGERFDIFKDEYCLTN